MSSFIFVGERRYYYDKRSEARLNPEKSMSLIIDGLDQGKTSEKLHTICLCKKIDHE